MLDDIPTSQYLIEIKKFFLKIILGIILFYGLILFGGLTYLFKWHIFSCDIFDDGQYLYQELGTGGLVTFEMYSGYLTNGHRAEGLFTCSDDFKYRCVIGDNNGFMFAVPRKLYIDTTHWNFNDSEFILRSDKNTHLLGTFAYRIELLGKDESEKFWYYYSPRKGLLAFGSIENKGTNMTYLVQSTCGILSAK